MVSNIKEMKARWGQLGQELIQDQYFWGICLLALVVLAQNIWVPGFFHDGYLYAAFGKSAAQRGAWMVPSLGEHLYQEFFQHTPMLFILEGLFFKIFPANFQWARTFGLIFTFVTVFGIYFTLRKRHQHWAFVSALLFLLIPALWKKSRFPNIDTALMMCFFFFMKSLWRALQEGGWKNHLRAGGWWGLALLFKGPFAFFLPGFTGLYLLLTKQWKRLVCTRLWGALVFGILIFCLYPLALSMIGRMDAFEIWVQSTFIHNLGGERVAHGKPWDYIVFCLKQLPHVFLLFLASWALLRKKLNDFEGFVGVFAGAYLVVISVPSLKFSNYLLPMYPAMCMAAAYFVCANVSKIKIEKAAVFFKRFAIAGAFIFMIFPVAKDIRRDPAIFKTKELTDSMFRSPTLWLIVDGSYPYYSLANMMGFMGDNYVYRLGRERIANVLNGDLVFENDFLEKRDYKGHQWVMIMTKSLFVEIRGQLAGRLVPLAEYRKSNLVMLVSRDALPKNLPIFSFD